MRWYTPEQQAELLSIPGGITGLWQSTSRNNSTFESGERQAIELEYIETASFKTDWRVFKGNFSCDAFRNGAIAQSSYFSSVKALIK